MEPITRSLWSPTESSEKSNTPQATMTLPESVPSNLSPCTTATSQPSLPNEVSHTDIAQQPLRFSDLPPELRGRIYAFAVHPGMTRDHDGKERPIMPELTTGLTKSPTARALSQVSRSVRKKSMEVFYSKTTFLVSDATDRPSQRSSSRHIDLPKREVMNRWAETWGGLAGPHIRSLSISASSGVLTEGVVLIFMHSQTNAASYIDKENDHVLEEAELNTVALKAFSLQGTDLTAAKKLARFFIEIGYVIFAGQVAAFHRAKYGKC
jgi:hypothetical protein